MFLKSIKLAGFKSFVDPTLIAIKSRLNAIVGPNGCGKSNVVDAVRWVVGEMSAKQLRGQSMSDVIFNGTKDRSSVGRASIELLFDNQSGRLGGPYAAYNEFAIRREIAREGTSNYFINGTICRRRDIVDIFFGTGLGSQSYAIIEQGMITRLIEAKPDELRVYLEEAAGISKYRDRRRETQTRMKQTQDNVDRLNDLLDELLKQKRHLRRQANAAERYKTLKQEDRHLNAKVKTLQWLELEGKLQSSKQTLQESLTTCDRYKADQREIEAKLESERLACNDAQQALNQTQQKYYQINTNIARFEEKIRHVEQQKQQWTEELEQTRSFKAQLSTQLQEQQNKTQSLQKQITDTQPALLEAEKESSSTKLLLQDQENAMQVWQKKWDEFQMESQRVLREKEVTQTQLTHYQNRINQLESLLANLKKHDGHQVLYNLQKEEMPLITALEQEEEKLKKVNEELSALQKTIEQKKSEKIAIEKERQVLEKDLYDSKRRLAVLEGLQAAAFGYNDEKLTNWLKTHKLMQHRRLAQCIEVDPEWEMAAEIILQDFFDALCVQSIESFHEMIHSFPEGRLTLIEKVDTAASHHVLPYITLDTKIKSHGLIDSVLKNIYLAKDLSEAYKIRTELAHGQSVITPSGTWFGQNWMRVFKAKEKRENVLSREKKLKDLSIKTDELESKIKQLSAQLLQDSTDITQLDSKREALQNIQQSTQSQITTLNSKLNEQRFKISELERQQVKVKQELEKYEQEYSEVQNLQLSNQDKQINLDEAAQKYAEDKPILLNEKQALETELAELRENVILANRRFDELTVRLSSSKSQLKILSESLTQAEQQAIHLTDKQSDLERHLSTKDSPVDEIKTTLQNTLNERIEVEANLNRVRTQCTDYETNMTDLKKTLQEILKNIGSAQTDIQDIRLSIQRMTLEQEHLKIQVNQLDYDIQKMRSELTDETGENELTQQLDKNQQRLSRLGPINLAAIHEHEEVSKRCEYLEKQKEDLLKALEVLKAAICKVDRETREQFRQTFDKVNENFSNLFPRIFEGGHAQLELTDTDLLKAGVMVKAQPPGKRNTSIHLLSGGEKTLTAIGLVFALFELNPAPFCILDEVDAPLDDLNVNRFCSLLQEMSDKTQFLIITHNKVTMEMADVLMGVTMQEAGVSRVVSVTMADAIKYAKPAQTTA